MKFFHYFFLLFLFYLILCVINFVIYKNISFKLFIPPLIISFYCFLIRSKFFTIEYIIFLNLLVTLYILSIYDLNYLYIEGWQVIVLLLSIIIYRLNLKIPLIINLFSIFLSILIFSIPYIISKREKIGLGDIIVFSIISIILTPVEVIILIILSSVSGLITVLIVSYFKILGKKIPLIPFISISLAILIPFKYQLLELFKLNQIYNLQFLY